jgi:hypothetical protein
VAGNTPLVRVPLLSADELKKVRALDAADKKRRAELEQLLPDAADRAYVSFLRHVISEKSAAYLLASSEYRQSRSRTGRQSVQEIATQRGLNQKLLAGFIDYLDRVAAQPSIPRHATLRDAAIGSLTVPLLEKSATALAKNLASLGDRRARDSAQASKQNSVASACLIRLRADDPHLLTDGEGRVLIWPNRGSLPADARPTSSSRGAMKSATELSDQSRTVLRFDGESLLAFPRRVPATGSLFVIFRASDNAKPGQRLLGWEDSDTGKHGLGLLVERGGRLHAVLRDEGKSGDLVDTHANASFDLVCVTWGCRGATLHRNGMAAGSQTGIDTLSSDPAVVALRIGGPGSGGSPRFQGELAEIRVYDRQLDEPERLVVEAELRASWLGPVVSKESPFDALNELYDELLSARGPFWLAAGERKAMLPPEDRARLESLSRELDVLKQRKPRDIPQAVVVQDGGPKGTRHEGFKDAQVFLRGNSKRLGKTVPRGIPRILVGDHAPQVRIAAGSGRRELADWLARTDNPLTARVMINRIWQHHFGEGLVRTPNDFGERGERPTNPALLDWLAARFVQSGWSVKAMHRLIMLSSAYQQSSDAEANALARDPDNRLFGRMNRRRLDAEAIRDSLLAVAGRLNATMGGAPFADLAVARRTLYLQSVRTGAGSADFGRVFDRADPGSIVGNRGESVVAPQALFFLNDPFVNEMARAIAARIEREEIVPPEARVQSLYSLTLGRLPSPLELDLANRALARKAGSNAWERYCQLIVCQNEFIYTD